MKSFSQIQWAPSGGTSQRDTLDATTRAVFASFADKAELFQEILASRTDTLVATMAEAGIAAMHALGHDEHPDVANYIGYANRKMGDYEQSKIWYEAALKADPNHVRTWSYYGMWQMEQGNRLKALEDLQKVQLICGSTTCEEYRQLKAVIDGTASPPPARRGGVDRRAWCCVRHPTAPPTAPRRTVRCDRCRAR